MPVTKEEALKIHGDCFCLRIDLDPAGYTELCGGCYGVMVEAAGRSYPVQQMDDIGRDLRMRNTDYDALVEALGERGDHYRGLLPAVEAGEPKREEGES